MEVLFFQALILMFLLTYLLVEESFIRRYTFTLEDAIYMDEWEREMEANAEQNKRSFFHRVIALGLEYAGSHPSYGAKGWDGV